MRIKIEFKDDKEKGRWEASLFFIFCIVFGFIDLNIDNWIRWWTR